MAERDYEEQDNGYEDDGVVSELDRRAYRHRRRVRNQIIVTVVTILLLAGIAAGCVFGVSKLAGMFGTGTSGAVTEEAAPESDQGEQIVIEGPSTPE